MYPRNSLPLRIRPAHVLLPLFVWLGGVPSLHEIASTPTAAASTQDASLPHVLVVATGGTIASRAGSPEQLSGYRPAHTGGELVAAVPAIADVARVSVEEYSRKPSSSITPADWLALARQINDALAAESYGDHGQVDGVVVTHGTDALEETAFFLNLTLHSEKPVVVVGAMRPASAISADGPLNLLNAIRVAGDPSSRGRGCLVVLNQEINSARDVTKTNTRLVQTFVARGLGVLGAVDNDRVIYYRSTERRHTYRSEFDVGGLAAEDLPRVDITYEYAGADGTDVEAFVAKGARGIVLAGAGAGSAAPEQGDALERVAESGVIVARSSRTGSGGVGRRRDDDHPNEVRADDLTPQKARILLMLALTVTSDPDEIRRIFDTY